MVIDSAQVVWLGGLLDLAGQAGVPGLFEGARI